MLLVVEKVGPYLDKLSRQVLLTSIVLKGCLYLSFAIATKSSILVLELGDMYVSLLEQILDLGYRYSSASISSLGLERRGRSVRYYSDR